MTSAVYGTRQKSNDCDVLFDKLIRCFNGGGLLFVRRFFLAV